MMDERRARAKQLAIQVAEQIDAATLTPNSPDYLELVELVRELAIEQAELVAV